MTAPLLENPSSYRCSRTLAAIVAVLALSLTPGARAEDDDVFVPCRPNPYEFGEPVVWGAPVLLDEWDDEEDGGAETQYEVGLSYRLDADVEALGGAVMPKERGLEVSGGPEVVALVRKRVAQLDAFSRGRGEFRVTVVRTPDDSDVRDEDTLRAAIASGRATVLLSERFTALRGEPVVRGDTVTTTFVSHIEAEVAQDAAITDPEVSRLRTGTRFGLWQRPIDDRRTRAVISLHHSVLLGTDRVETSAGSVDVPRVAFVSAVVPSVLERGRRTTCTFDDPTEGGRLCLVAEVLSLPDVPDEDELGYALVDVAAMTGIGTMPPEVPMGVDEAEYEAEPGDGYAHAERVAERWTYAAENVEQLSSVLLSLPKAGFDLPEAPAAPVADARARLRTWSLPRASLAAVPGWDPLDGVVGEASRAGAESVARSLAVAPSLDMRVPVRADAVTFVARGTWTRYVDGVNVEIAAGAAVRVPAMRTYVDGERLLLRRTADGRLRATRTAVRTLGRTDRPLAVLTEIDGQRRDERDDVHTAIRHRRTSGTELVAPAAPRVRVSSFDETAELRLWQLE